MGPEDEICQSKYPPTKPQKKRSAGREFDADMDRNGPIDEQIKNVDNVIARPIARLGCIRVPSELIAFAKRIKRLIKTTFRGYSDVAMERLCILHFLYALKEARAYKKKDVRAIEQYAKKIVSTMLLKRYIREEKKILKLIKCNPPSKGE